MTVESSLGFVNLFIQNPLSSSAFYQKILGLQPIQESPPFVLFALKNGVMLGLWSLKTAAPSVTTAPGSSEICFSSDKLDKLYQAWLNEGITMAQPPTTMDFGRTFVALDPDGHRIRVYTMKEKK